eukprot:gene7263-5109_t
MGSLRFSQEERGMQYKAVHATVGNHGYCTQSRIETKETEN